MSGTNTPLLAASVAALALIGAGGYFAFGRSPVETPAPAVQTASSPAVAETEAAVPQEPEPVKESAQATSPPVATPVAEAVERPASRPVTRPPSRAESPRQAQPTTRQPATTANPTVERSPAPSAPAVARDDPRPAAAEPSRPDAGRSEPARQDASRPDASAPRDAAPAVEASRDRVVEARPQELPAPRAQAFVIPADSVIGLELEDTVSSESAKVEQRVQGRVTRDVRVDGTVVIPAGARARGEVTLVEDGGRFKERARLGVRFHTLVLDDGSSVPIQTETIYREGNDVAKGSAARIGGSAVGGAIIGAIFGGGKGAAIGAAAGAGAGTAATMAGQRSHATLTAGTRLTARLSSPAEVTVEAPARP